MTKGFTVTVTTLAVIAELHFRPTTQRRRNEVSQEAGSHRRGEVRPGQEVQTQRGISRRDLQLHVERR